MVSELNQVGESREVQESFQRSGKDGGNVRMNRGIEQDTEN